jgi:serine protease Do
MSRFRLQERAGRQTAWGRIARCGMQSVVALGLLIAGSPLVAAERTVSTATTAVATATPQSEVAATHLKELLAGESPVNVADLKAMQGHVQKLTDQLAKSTVGVHVGQAQGSGVIISKDGYVLTAAHVAGKPNQDVRFVLSDGREVSGKTLGLCRSVDAGLMKITDSGDYQFAEMGKSDDLHEGQWCLALGHPGGYQSDRGVVLRLGRVVLTQKEAITTDCTLVGGDSGGPLFDMDGKVIGINSRIAGPLTANMHAPVGAFSESWDRLLKGDAWGHYPGQEPYIGVKGEEGASNAKLKSVVPGSPAERAKLQAGDVILKFDGADITDFKSLADAVASHQPRERVKVVVQRGEETVELKLQLGRKG